MSTDEQAVEGVSLEAQVARIRAYASLHDLDLVEVVTDAGESGKSLDRPGLRKVLTALRDYHAGALIVTKLDRLTRSLADWQHLVERYFASHVRLCSVAESVDTHSAGGRLVLNVMLTVAQWEREAIVERTRAALDHKRSKGELIGSVPYGTRLAADGRTLEVDPGEVAILALLRDLASQGVSVRGRIHTLQAMGFRPRSGGAWTPGAVSHLTRIASATASLINEGADDDAEATQAAP